MGLRTLVLTLAALLAAPVLAHPGGTDSQGCHTDSATGVRHCHGGGGGGGDTDVALVVALALVLVAVVGVVIYVNHKKDTTVSVAPWVSDEGAGGVVVVRW